MGVYKNGKCVLHKSDKKYVCRKKAGQRQLAKDKNAGSSIKSIGSQIRYLTNKYHFKLCHIYKNIILFNKKRRENEVKH